MTKAATIPPEQGCVRGVRYTPLNGLYAHTPSSDAKIRTPKPADKDFKGADTGGLIVIAHLRAFDGQIEAARVLLTSLIAPMRAEPGCVEYWLHQYNDDPAEFTFYENWTNRAEWDKHMKMPHLTKFATTNEKGFELQNLRLMTMISDPVSAR